jgi:uncharacterized protein YxjI
MNVLVATRVKINKCKPLKKQVMTKAKQVVHFLLIIIHGNILNPSFKFQAGMKTMMVLKNILLEL